MNVGTLTGTIEIEDQTSGVLNQISARVKAFVSDFGLIGAVALGATAAIGGVTAAITALGVRGSDVNDLTETLDRFAGGAQNAQKILEQMRAGTKNTVTDFNLLKTSTRLLAADVKLSAADFGTMTQAAKVLSGQGLGPTKNMLDLISTAMLTGRARSLEMVMGKIDLRKAEENYAKSLGTTAKNLNEAGKVEAHRIGIIAVLAERVQMAGTAHESFADKIDKAKVFVKNWFDQLSAAVAKSPAVLVAIDSMGRSILDAFGGSSQAAIQKVMGWINSFADSVTRYSPVVIEWIAKIFTWTGKLVEGIWNIVTAAKDTWDSLPNWFQEAAKGAAIAGLAIGMIGPPVVNAGKSVFDFARLSVDGIRGVTDAWGLLKEAHVKMIAESGSVKGAIMGWVDALAYYTTGMGLAQGATTLFNKVLAASPWVAVVLGLGMAAKANIDYFNATTDSERQTAALDNTLMKMLPDFITHREAIKHYTDTAIAGYKKVAEEAERNAARTRKAWVDANIDVIRSVNIIAGSGVYAERGPEMDPTGGMAGLVGSFGKGPLSKKPPTVDHLKTGTVDEIQKIANALSGAELQKKVDELAAAFNRLNPAQQAAAISSGRYAAAIKPLAEAGAKLAASMQKERDKLDQTAAGWAALTRLAIAHNSAKEASILLADYENTKWDRTAEQLAEGARQREIIYARTDALEKQRARSSDTALQQQMNAVDDWVESQLSGLDETAEGYQRLADIVEAEAARMRKALNPTGDRSGLGKITWNIDPSTFKGEGEKAGASFKKAFASAITNIGNVIVRALEGGGNVLKSIFASLGNDLANALSASYIERIKTSGMSEASQALSGAAMTAGWGIVIAMVPQIIDGFKKVQREVTSTEKLLQDLEARFRLMGAEGVAAFNALTGAQAIFNNGSRRQSGPTTGQATSRSDQDAYLNMLSQFQTKSELDAIVANWKKAYDKMLASGLYTAAALADAWKKYQDAITNAAGVVDPVADLVAGFPTRAQLEMAAANAEAAYIRIRDSGLYTAGTVEQAFLAWQNAMIAAGDAGTIAMRKLDEEIKSLTESVKDEAPEEVMGVIEAAARARIAVLEEEKRKAMLSIEYQQTEAERAAAAAENSAEKAFERAKFRAINLDDQMRKLFSVGYDIPLRFTNIPGGPGGPGTPTPSVPPPSSQADSASVPARSGGTAIFQMGEREMARILVPPVANEINRLRLGKR